MDRFGMALQGGMVGKMVDEISSSPVLLLDRKVFESNCRKMLSMAKEAGVKLRCHTKTHKTLEGAIIQTGGTKRGLVTSTLAECEMYAVNGFEDILYGFPLIEAHMDRNYALRQDLNEYHVMASNLEAVEVLCRRLPPPDKKWSVFLEVDVGYQRTGVPAEDPAFVRLAKAIWACPTISFRGLYAHCGNSYSSASPEEVARVRDSSICKILQAAKDLRALGIEVPEVGIGSTPTCSLRMGDSGLDQLTEIHPGNYVFYDLQQMMLGSCSLGDVAVTVQTRIVAAFPDRNEIIIDAGFTALGEQGFEELGRSYAWVKGHPDLAVVKMTQELGFVRPRDPERFKMDMSKYPVGSTLELYQYHSCHTAFHYPVYYVHQDGIVTEEWRPVRGW